MRRLIAITALLASAATLLFALFGCTHRLTGTLKADQPPHTLIFVQGPVDTVNHLVHLYWYGTDDDGYVVAYEIKLVNPEDTVAADSAWKYTTRTDSVFAIYTPQGHASPTLYVRAIDNTGVRDPHPAVEDFKFSNHAPFVTWKTVPSHLDRSDTSYASVSVTWTISDPDGNVANAKYRIWLDGNDSHPDIVSGALGYTVHSNRFLVNGAWTTGPRTLYLQAIDDGGMAGNTISTTWYVKAPVDNPNMSAGRRPGRLLILDDLNKANATNWVDSLYTNTAARNLPAGTWSVMRLDQFQPIKTSMDLYQTLSLFDAVIWYRGVQDTVSTLMQNFEPGLRAYIQTGGNVYLEGLEMFQGVNAEGSLSSYFVTDYLNSTGMRNVFASTPGFIDSTSGWSNRNNALFLSDMYPDTLKITLLPAARVSTAGGIRVFNVKDNSQVALWAPPAALSPANPDSYAVAVSVPQPSGGRVVVFSLPIANALPRGSSVVPRMMANIFAQLGLTGP